MIALVAAFAPLFAAPAVGTAHKATTLQTAPSAVASSAGPIEWHADKMRMESRAHHVFLDGDVHISRAGLLILGERAVADLVAQEAAPAQSATGAAAKKTRPDPVAIPGLGEQVQRFVIDGAVHVEKGARRADGDHAVYDAPAQTLTLSGAARKSAELPEGSPQPVLRDEKETLSGETILMHLDSDEVEVAQPHLTLLRSQAPGAAGSAPAVPARVEARTLLIDQEKHVMRFRDQVVLHRGDLTVTGPRMIARSSGDGEIDVLEMNGGVQLRRGERRATGRNAVYDAKKRTVVLTGEPRLYDRGDEMTAERIEMSLDTDEVWGDRVHAHMHADAHQGETMPAPKAGTAGANAKGTTPTSSGGAK